MILSTPKTRTQYWIRHYRQLVAKGMANDRGIAIANLDYETATLDDLAELGLYESHWAECEECGNHVEDFLILGDKYDTIFICKDCLEKALELFQK